MFSKISMLKTTVLIVAMAFSASAPAFANGGGGNKAEAAAAAVAGAGASANVNGGKSYNLSGSVGAAQCANAFSLLGVAASFSDQGCDLVMASVQGYQAGLTTRAEARAIYFAGVKAMGVTLKKAAGSKGGGTTSVSTKGKMMNVTGAWKSLSRAEQLAVTGCDATWNGDHIKACVN